LKEEKQIPLSMKLGIAKNYMPTAWWLLRNRGWRHFYNFMYTKAFVPTGEGAGGAFRSVQARLFRHWPELAGLPRQIEVEQDNYCPQKCFQCELSYWAEKPAYCDFASFMSIVDDLPVKWMNVSAIGEPFLNPYYLMNLEYAKSKGIFLNIVDDFRLVTGETANRVLDLGIDSFWISLDGATAKTYNIVRQNFNFEEILSHIREFIAKKTARKQPVPEICFRYIVNKYNVKEMPDFVDLITSFGTRKELGAGSRIEFASILTFPEIQDLYLEKIPEDIIQETEKRAREKDVCVVMSHLEKPLLPPMSECLAWMEPFVTADGYVLPCCAILMSNKRSFLREYSFGYVKGHESIRHIWNTPYYKWFRANVMKGTEVPALCSGCRAYSTEDREKRYGVDRRTRLDF